MNEHELISSKFYGNIRRVISLSTLPFQGTTRQLESNDLKSDIFRSAIVLLHSSLEDFLRSIALWQLPRKASEEVLDKICFQGTEKRKIGLGSLKSYEDETARDIIEASVKEHLEKVSYSKTDSVAELLKNIGLQADHFKEYYPEISKLMERRHKIAHFADLENDNNCDYDLEPIDRKDIACWIETVDRFGKEVLRTLEKD